MKLLLSQKDEIFELIKGFDLLTPNQFKIQEDLGNYKTTIYFKDSEYFFRFISNDHGYWAHYSPGVEKFTDTTTYLNWIESINHIDNWLFCLIRELRTPNYWENFKNQISGINFRSDYDNTRFSHKEFLELDDRMSLLKARLTEIPLILEQQNEILLHLERLTEAAKELGKFDWKNLFIGTILSILIQLNVTPENANAIWELIKHTFNQYFLE